MSRGTLLLVALLLSVPLLSGCVSNDEPQGKEQDLRFAVELSTASLQPGESVTIRLTLRSISPAPVTITFTSGKRADVLITNPTTADQPYSFSADKS